MNAESKDPWWVGDALTVGPRGLELDGTSLADLAAKHATPFYAYGTKTLERRIGELRRALESTGAPFRIQYAMKAARFVPVLEVVRRQGDIGIDACSPREVERALGVGFSAKEISVTAGMLSNRDLAQLASYGVHVNLDTRSVLRRWAATPGARRDVGLRVNPMVRIGRGDDPKHSYGDSKFGFDPESVQEAATYAASLGLTVDELHVHAGWGLEARVEKAIGELFASLAQLARAIPTVRTLNLGGGLSWRLREEEDPLALATWAKLVQTYIAPTGLTVACEPGTFIAASSGVLVAEVNTIEGRRSGTWVGIDAGHNVNVFAAHYSIPLTILPVARPLDPLGPPVHVAGNINEANDVFARDLRLPALEEGDLVAFYPAGAYGASMASDHCMRSLPLEVLV